MAIVLIGGSSSAAEPPAGVTIDLRVEPREATIGDPLKVELTVGLPRGTSLEPPVIGPELGPFEVRDGSWAGPVEQPEGVLWTWTASLTAFETGELEIPPIAVRIGEADGESGVSTEPVAVTIRSVLEQVPAGEEAGEIADLKPPAAVAPDYGPLGTALAILLLLLLGAALLWWLHRRYGPRLAAADRPADPFRRTPPHVWVYGELQRLLERRLPEQGQVDLFYEELSRILKRYLSGRYRVDLMERTTAEVPPALRQAGLSADAVGGVEGLLRGCDLVKFAAQRRDAAACREAVEETYRIVDLTKPVGATPIASRRGAA